MTTQLTVHVEGDRLYERMLWVSSAPFSPYRELKVFAIEGGFYIAAPLRTLVMYQAECARGSNPLALHELYKPIEDAISKELKRVRKEAYKPSRLSQIQYEVLARIVEQNEQAAKAKEFGNWVEPPPKVEWFNRNTLMSLFKKNYIICSDRERVHRENVGYLRDEQYLDITDAGQNAFSIANEILDKYYDERNGKDRDAGNLPK